MLTTTGSIVVWLIVGVFAAFVFGGIARYGSEDQSNETDSGGDQ